MRIGLIGLPQSGKSTVFQALTGVKAAGQFGGRDQADVAVVKVPDQRIDALVPLFNPKKTIYATAEFVDIAGLQGSTSEPKEGFSPSMLAEARQVDTLALVIGAFLPGSDPRRDLEEVELELNFSDLAVIERRLERLEADIKKSPVAARATFETERDLLRTLKDALDSGTPIRDVAISRDDERSLRGYGFLTAKPLFIILNVGENPSLVDTSLPVSYVLISGEIEAEIAELEPEDAREFLEDLGMSEPGINRVIRHAYESSRMISFFTVGPDEVRAWTIPDGATAVEAAGVIHTDLARGFIRAEVIAYDHLIECGSLAEARRRGLLRLEGKSYTVGDGDICHFLSNV